MARRIAKPAAPTPVQAVRHTGDSRVNIPTAETQSLAEAEEAGPQTLRYPRDPSLDPQRRRAALDLHRDQYRRCDSAPWLNGNARDLAIVLRDERVARAWKHTRGLSSVPSRPVLVNRGIV